MALFGKKEEEITLDGVIGQFEAALAGLDSLEVQEAAKIEAEEAAIAKAQMRLDIATATRDKASRIGDNFRKLLAVEDEATA